MAQYNINVGVNAYQAARGITQIRASLGQLNRTADRSRNLLSNLFTLPLLGIYTFQSAVTNVVSVLADFSQSMAEVRAITGATTTQSRQLEQEFIRLGRTTRFTASEAAKAGVQLARAGFDTMQILGVSEAALQLARATAIDTGRAADIATNVLTAFNLTVEETTEVFDALTFTTARTNTDLASLSEALKFIAPAAESANIPLNQIVAALGILAQAGIRGSIAGTGLRRVISKLAAESPVVEKRLAEIGLSFEDINLRGGDLIGVFLKLIESGVGLGEAFALFGDRGGPAFEAVADRLPEVERLSREISQAAGFTEQLAEIMSMNLRDAMIRVGSAIEAVILALGRLGLESSITAVLDSLTFRIRAVAADVDTFSDILQSIVVLLGSAVFATIARTLISVVSAFTGITQVGRAALTTIGSIGAAFVRFRTPLAAAAGLVIALSGGFRAIIGIVRRVSLVVIPLLVGFSDDIRLVGQNIVSLQDFLESLGLAFLRSLVPGLEDVMNIQIAFQNILDSVITFVSSEGFLRRMVQTVDLVVRALLAAGEAFRIAFDTRILTRLYNAFIGVIRTRIDRVILLPVLQAVHAIQSINPFEDTSIRAIRESLINELEQGLENSFGEDFGNRLGGIEGLERITDLITQPIITFDDVLQDATDIASSRLIEYTELQRRIAAQRPIERLPVTLQIEPQPQEVVDERIFRRYLADKREEFELLGLTNRQRQLQQVILDAEEKTKLELNSAQRDELTTLVAGIQVRNTLLQQTRELNQANEMLLFNSNERERQARVQDLQSELLRELTSLERFEALALIDLNILLEQQSKLYDDIRGPQLAYANNTKALLFLLGRGTITIDEYINKLRDLQIESLNTRTDFLAGIQRGLLGLQHELSDFAATAERAVMQAFSAMEDALVEFVTTGKLSFSGLIDSILADITRLVVRQTITTPLVNAFSSILGPSVFGAPAAPILPTPFARGGVVEGGGTATSDSIPALLSRGEFVVNANATRRHMQVLQAINAGTGVPTSSTSQSLVQNVSVQVIAEGRNESDVEVQETTAPDGQQLIRVLVRDTTRQLVSDGSLDSAFSRRFGVRNLAT